MPTPARTTGTNTLQEKRDVLFNWEEDEKVGVSYKQTPLSYKANFIPSATIAAFADF